jgi:hypothetical protein
LTAIVLPDPSHFVTATTLRMVGGLVFFCAMVTFNLWAVVTGLDRVEQVNRHFPADQQFAALGWTPVKKWGFEKEYERLFPDRQQRTKERRLWLCGAISLCGAWFCLAPFL